MKCFIKKKKAKKKSSSYKETKLVQVALIYLFSVSSIACYPLLNKSSLKLLLGLHSRKNKKKKKIKKREEMGEKKIRSKSPFYILLRFFWKESRIQNSTHSK